MKEMKNLCLRLPEGEYAAFDLVCREKGYSKTGKIRELIRKLVKEELESVKVSTREWSEIEKGIKEIERGDYVNFEELKRGLKKK
jgi:predicted transcriptional regulator